MSYAQGKDWALIQADCLRALAVFPENRFDSCVTDPPYELGFMGKKWDASGIAFSVDLWRAVLRVLKPGAHLLAFGGTRTAHRMACAIEDAGFEIRDDLHWFYGTGFPKSKTAASGMPEGQGTALKPAHEPVYLARKPLVGTLEKNIAAFGTGGLQIDACRIWRAPDDTSGWSQTGSGASENRAMSGANYARAPKPDAPGRWPANVLLDEQAAAELDKQSGAWDGTRTKAKAGSVAFSKYGGADLVEKPREGDSGGASRFFYVAKPGRKERDAGCDHLPARSGGEATDREDDSAGVANPRAGAGRTGGKKREQLIVEVLWENEVRQAVLQVDTAASPPKVIAASGALKISASEWNTILFGSKRTGPSLPASTSTTATKISSTTESKIWSWFRGSLTSAFTEAALSTPTVNGKSPVENANESGLLLTITGALTASLLGAPVAASTTLLRIRGSGQLVAEGIRNHHCTVKPVELMRYLVRLVTPVDGTVLDPFCGSGTTGIAARLEARGFLGIEREADYFTIAEARIRGAA